MTMTLTGVGDLEPGGSGEDSLAGISAGVEPVLILPWGEDIRYGEDETQEPRNQDGHNDLMGQEE